MTDQLPNKLLKKQARYSLKENWGVMAWITFLSFIIPEIIESIVTGLLQLRSESIEANGILFLLNVTLFFAFSYGTYYCALQISRGKLVKSATLLEIFQSEFYIPMLIINLIQSLLYFIIKLVLFLPIILFLGTLVYLNLLVNALSLRSLLLQLTEYPLLILLLFLVYIALFLATLFIESIFEFTIWIKLDEPMLSVKKSFSFAFYLLKRRFGKYIGLELSFLGWYVLGILSFGIGLLWVIPYRNVTIATFYDYVKQEQVEKNV